MVVRLLMLAVLVVIASAFTMAASLLAHAVLSAILAIAVAAAAIFTPSSALTRVAGLLRPFLIVALAAPAIWMVLQLFPIPVPGLGNPIWATASAALNESLSERLTVDVRATMLALAQYSAVVAVALVVAVVASDKLRATQILYTLASITAFVSAFSIWCEIGSSYNPLGANTLAAASGSVPAVLGVLLSVAIAIRAIDQLPRPGQARRFTASTLTHLSVALLLLVICLAAILVRDSSTIVMAALLGAAILLAAFAIRKWFYGLWGTAGVLATIAVAFLAAFTVMPIKRDTDLTVALSTQSQAATERMLQEVRLVGSGAGTYAMLLPIHRDIGMTALQERPTAAAAVAIEMGRAFFCGLLIVAGLGGCTLFRRSLLPGYEYVYAATGAAASVSLLLLALADDAILGLGASLLVAALFGLAFGQSRPAAARKATQPGSRKHSDELNGQDSKGRAARSLALDSTWARVVLTSVAVALIAQSGWLLSHGWYFGGGFSTGILATSEALTDKERGATSIATARGDSWTQERLAQTKINEAAASSQQNSSRPPASNAVAEALRYSPLRGDLWLTLAAKSKDDTSIRYDAATLLKLSYYTAPNEVNLIPLRLSVALGTDAAIRDPELRDLVKRDLRVAVTNRSALRPAIIAAYQSASADGRTFAENLISELDPGYLQSMRTRRP